MKKEIREVIEAKNGRKYEVTNIITDTTEVYKRLAADLVNKKLCSCSYIKSIKRTQNYNGTIDITVTYDNNIRSIYTIEDR